MTTNATRKGYTAPGTKHTPKVRKGVGGRPVPVDVEPRAFPVARGPRKGAPSPANVRAAALFGDLAPTRVLVQSRDVPAPTPGQARRRDRRPAMVAAARDERVGERCVVCGARRKGQVYSAGPDGVSGPLCHDHHDELEDYLASAVPA